MGKLLRVKLDGHGLHGGEAASVQLVATPGPLRIEKAGIARPIEAFRVVSTQFSTTIACDAFEVGTVEHLFAALAALGIRAGLRIVVTGGELPFLDGGARAFCEVLAVRTDPTPTRVVRDERIEVDGSVYEFSPGPDVRVEVAVDLPPCCTREASWNGDASSFVRDIASARTFMLARDADELSKRGLARHVDPKSVLVVTDDAIVGAGAIRADEPARHKLLDLIGDAYLHGGPPRGVVRATRPGHGRNHAAFARAIATGVIASAMLFASRVANADDAARPPTLVDLTHAWPEITLETTLASVTYNDFALQGTTYVRVERLAYEMPIARSPWYLGAAYDAAIGHDDDGSPRFVSGNPEIWGRGVWNATYGLAFGGGFSLVIPTKSYTPEDASATTAYAAIAARGWDRALFDPDNATLRPFLDIRLVTGPITVQYRQALEVATDFGDVSFRFAAVGTLYWGVRFSKLVTAGASIIEYYRLEPGLDDSARPYFAVGAHVAIETKYFQPSIGLMTNIGSPLNAISRIGAPINVAPTSFIGVHFSLDFPFRGVTIFGKKKQMKAIVIREPGGPEVLEVRDVPEPDVERGEARVRIRATAVNRADVLQRMGVYPAPPGSPKDIPGLEFAGEIDAIGEGVTEHAVGDRVFGIAGGGTYAEKITLPARAIAKMPRGLSFENAGAIPEAFLTAYDAFDQARLHAGERVLISAVGSGVGTAAAQIARALGARPYGTARTQDKIDRAKKLGLIDGVVPQNGTFADAITKVMGGPADVIIELAGGDYVTEDLTCVALRGRIVVVGLVAGPQASLQLGALLHKRATIIGTVLRARPVEEKIRAAQMLERELAPLFEDEKLVPVVDRVLPLERVREAHEAMQKNETFGKLVLTV